jgi:hypothetical protein
MPLERPKLESSQNSTTAQNRSPQVNSAEDDRGGLAASRWAATTAYYNITPRSRLGARWDESKFIKITAPVEASSKAKHFSNNDSKESDSVVLNQEGFSTIATENSYDEKLPTDIPKMMAGINKLAGLYGSYRKRGEPALEKYPPSNKPVDNEVTSQHDDVAKVVSEGTQVPIDSTSKISTSTPTEKSSSGTVEYSFQIILNILQNIILVFFKQP